MEFCFATVNSLMVFISTGNQLYFIRSRHYDQCDFRLSISKTVLWWLWVANMFLSRIFQRNWQRKSLCSIWENAVKIGTLMSLPNASCSVQELDHSIPLWMGWLFSLHLRLKIVTPQRTVQVSWNVSPRLFSFLFWKKRRFQDLV